MAQILSDSLTCAIGSEEIEIISNDINVFINGTILIRNLIGEDIPSFVEILDSPSFQNDFETSLNTLYPSTSFEITSVSYDDEEESPNNERENTRASFFQSWEFILISRRVLVAFVTIIGLVEQEYVILCLNFIIC